MTDDTYESALLDPQAVYDCPDDMLADDALTIERKREVRAARTVCWTRSPPRCESSIKPDATSPGTRAASPCGPLQPFENRRR